MNVKGTGKKVVLFDWGNTIMRDFPDEKGPMHAWGRVEMIPNANKMLEKLTGKCNCYLATNAKDSTKADINKALERVNLKHYFKDIFCYKQVGYFKPSSEYFENVVNILNVKKSDVVMVGDNLENDVKGAIKNGIDAILYDPNNKYPDYQGEKISDLLEILEM